MLTKEVQLNEYVNLEDIKPNISNSEIYLPISVEHTNLEQYHGDARSFGFHFDDGLCTIVTYEQAVGVLAEDTSALLEECGIMKKHMKKPTHHILEITEPVDCNTETAELLIRYDDEYFYKDEKGFFFKTEYYAYGATQRVTDESAEIYREVNKEYQRQIVKYNALMKEALSNLESLKNA